MKKVEIRNISKGSIIASQGMVVDSFLTRLKGLIGRKKLCEDEGFCIKPCKGVHTFFMRFSIDIVFVDNNGEVCEILKGLKPYKVSKFISDASYVIELAGGKCEKINIEIGDKIELQRIDNP